jgi:hypothetical protein
MPSQCVAASKAAAYIVMQNSALIVMRSPDNIPSSIVQINKIRIYQFVLYTTRIITSRFYSEVVMASDSSFLGLKNRRRRSSLASGLSNSRPSPVSAPPATSSVPTAAPSIAQEPTAIGNERTIVWRSVRCSTSQVICEVKDITRIKVEWIPSRSSKWGDGYGP